MCSGGFFSGPGLGSSGLNQILAYTVPKNQNKIQMAVKFHYTQYKFRHLSKKIYIEHTLFKKLKIH